MDMQALLNPGHRGDVPGRADDVLRHAGDLPRRAGDACGHAGDACGHAGTEVTTSLHPWHGGRRTAMNFEAGNEIDVAAPQVSVHSDCNAVPPGPLRYFSTSLTLRLSWELLTGRYGEDSGGGGGARAAAAAVPGCATSRPAIGMRCFCSWRGTVSP